ncbi:MAG: ABC transporter permease subunit [Clostridia bacterium]|jgi:ABC-2 type transport system permease protein|nr:ABC transporter permease subunit [Clostridia bacterium]
MGAIIKKEIKTYFLSPIGYIFIGLFLAMCSVFFYLDVFYYQSVQFENMFYSLATILTFIIPILTMRIFSEERKTGTEQLLYTSPISITKIVLGKFFSAVIVMIIAEICTLVYFIILTFFGTPHIQTAIITLLGFTLLSMSYIAFGVFASSITENQIIAGVVTISFFIISWFLPNFNSQFSTISLINMFNKFPAGLIAIEEIAIYTTFSVLCILLTIIVLQRKKSIK